MEQPATKRRRLPAAERRQQIIDAVLEVTSEHGIPGTTIARVANTAGIGVGTVYRYFADQKEMLNAAVGSMAEVHLSITLEMTCDNAIDHLRQMAARRTAIASADGGKMARLWLEFVAANPRLGIQNTMFETQKRAFQVIHDVCELGIRQGTIRPDVDLIQVSYLILAQAWGADLSLLVGMGDTLGRDCSSEVLDKLLSDIAV